MTSSRPYLLRALLDWIVDNGMTPHLLVDAGLPEVVVPRQFVQDQKITLNIGPAAVQRLEMGDRTISFSARFAGTPMQVQVPVGAVLAIFARENGQGMMFGNEPGSDIDPGPADGVSSDAPAREAEPQAASRRKGPNLKVIK